MHKVDDEYSQKMQLNQLQKSVLSFECSNCGLSTLTRICSVEILITFNDFSFVLSEQNAISNVALKNPSLLTNFSLLFVRT